MSIMFVVLIVLIQSQYFTFLLWLLNYMPPGIPRVFCVFPAAFVSSCVCLSLLPVSWVLFTQHTCNPSTRQLCCLSRLSPDCSVCQSGICPMTNWSFSLVIPVADLCCLHELQVHFLPVSFAQRLTPPHLSPSQFSSSKVHVFMERQRGTTLGWFESKEN